MQVATQTETATVAALAARKRLPEAWLRQTLGVYDLDRGGVGIPYYGVDYGDSHDGRGKVLATRLRYALSAKDGSRWRAGDVLHPYGIWRRGNRPFHGGGQLWLVEGETSAWTLWHHRYPCLGLPGASSGRQTLHADALEGIDVLWLVLDPGRSGEEFLRGVCAALTFCRYRGQVLTMDCGAVKDVSDLHCAGPDDFSAAFLDRQRAAATLSPACWMGPGALRQMMGEALRDPSPWFKQQIMDAVSEEIGHRVGNLVAELIERGGVARA